MRKSKIVNKIRKSGKTIYDAHEADLIIPAEELQRLLSTELKGLKLAGLANRTRSKVLKQAICQAMGYVAPSSFRRVRPQLLAQDINVFSNQARNLQVWTGPMDPLTRCVIVILSDDSVVKRIQVLTGAQVEALDLTKTLTNKYQATMIQPRQDGLLSPLDTASVQNLIRSSDGRLKGLLPIDSLYRRLKALEGSKLNYSGATRERSQGVLLQEAIHQVLKFSFYDNGQFPDVPDQLLEVKLQMAPTIDLGNTLPNSPSLLALPKFAGLNVSAADVRYAIFKAQRIESGRSVLLEKLYLVSGKEFFSFFRQFGGKVKNSKTQRILPAEFFR